MSIKNNSEIMSLVKNQEPKFMKFLLLDKENLEEAFSIGFDENVNKNPFFIKNLKQLFIIVCEHYKKYKSLLTEDAISHYCQANSLDSEAKILLVRTYEKCLKVETTEDEFDFLKHCVHERHIQEYVLEILSSTSLELGSATNNQIDIVKLAQQKFLALDNLESDSYIKSYSIGDAADLAWEDITKRREEPDSYRGIMTGMSGLDELTLGIEPGSYTVFAGIVNGGKTTLMLNVAFKAALLGSNVVYITIEKDAVPITQRIISLHGLVDYNRIKRGGKSSKGLSDEWLERLRESKDDVKKLLDKTMHIVQATHGVKMTALLAEVDKIRKNHKVDLVVLDYLGVVGHERLHPGRPDLDLGLSSQMFQGYGKRNKIACATGTQITNEATKELRKIIFKLKDDKSKDGGEITLGTETLGGSQKVIADADTGIFVLLNGDSPPTQAYLGILKGRDVAANRGSWMDFDGNTANISDPSYDPGEIVTAANLSYNSELKIEDCEGLEEISDLFDNASSFEIPKYSNKNNGNKTEQRIQEVDVKEEETEENKIDFLCEEDLFDE